MSRKLEVGLTLRELQVARLVREGLTDRQVAEKLFITRRTAEWHLKQIFNKLGVNSRSQVAAWVAHDQAVGSTDKSSDEHRQNLPLHLTTFVGRRKQLDEVQRLLDTKRLVTLTAVGGAGKTRLALEVARRVQDSYPDGTWFVDLTEVKDGHLISRAFGSALGVHERPRQPMAETLIQHLSGLHLLLVVDNCEHVIEDCARLVDTIHRSCPGITILATSREPLRVRGETVWGVPLLTLPDPAAPINLRELPEYEAVDLFLNRAQLAEPQFRITVENAPAVAELCRRMEGIPLATELAAARVGLMSPEQILERLQDRFGLLTGGSRTSPTRHRTLQSALDWSHALLSDRERTLFRRLSIFAGSFTLEAVEAVCSGDDLERAAITALLGSLVDKSFVIVVAEVSAPIRFRMLETLQQYGHGHLTDSGELERLSRRQCEFFVALAEEAFPNLIGREQQAWHQRLGQDLGNLRAALEWSADREPLANLRLNSALTDFWYIHGLVQEGDGRLKKALAGYKVRDKLRARALALGGQISYWRGDVGDYSAGCHECLEICRELGDREGAGRALAWVGQVAEWQCNFEEAHEYYDSGLAISREVDNPRAIADILRYVGRLAMKEGDNARARAFLEESLAYYERIADQRPISWNLAYLGLNAIEGGDFTAARSHLERALSIGRALDSTILVAIPLMYFAALAAAQSHTIRALRLAEASESLAESTGAVPIRLTRSIVEGWLDKSRLELGPERSAACRSEGHAMTRESAIKYALDG
jgi:predicted ATPase/DNA-binding CsgD family transcriptional regulator